MDLGTGNLLERLKDAVDRRGLPGIPAAELLGYMRDAAEGLDYLNGYRHASETGLLVAMQHKDVKPENLVVFGNGVKVADLGVAQVLDGERAARRSGFTPVYAPPEFFDDRPQVTRWSDEYSLAVTYCQLRGNRMPFKGTGWHEQKAERQGGHMDLSMLPPPERPAVARALAAVPEARHDSCRDFVDALAAVAREVPGRESAAPVVRIVLPRGELILEPGSRGEALPVRVFRGGCDERLRLRCEGLPAGVSATTCVIPSDKEGGRLELTARSEAAGQTGTVRLVAEAGGAVIASGEFGLTVTVDSAEQARASRLIRQLGGAWEFEPEAPRGWAVKAVKAVVDVTLSHARVSADQLGTILRAMPSLRVLNLYNTGVTDDGLLHLRYCPRLRHLDLSRTKVKDKGLEQVGKLAPLGELSLLGCSVSNEGLAHLAGLHELRVFNLSFCTEVGDRGLMHLQALAALERLVLAGTAVTLAGERQLQGLRKQHGLRPLKIDWGCQAGDSAAGGRWPGG